VGSRNASLEIEKSQPFLKKATRLRLVARSYAGEENTLKNQTDLKLFALY
jgi:hypothetical protein